MTTHTIEKPEWATRIDTEARQDGGLAYDFKRVLDTEVPVGDGTVTFDINQYTGDDNGVMLSCDDFHLDIPIAKARAFAEGILAVVDEAEALLGSAK